MRRRLKSQSGAVLVLATVMILTLLAFLAYAVDLNLLLLSREKGQYFARIAALSAVEEYYATTCDADQSEAECFDRRIRRAVARVNSIGFSNKMANSSERLRVSTDPSDLDAARLIPGRWIAEESEADECQGNAPCFKPLALNEYQANAFKVEGAFRSGIPAIFSRLAFGANRLFFKANAVATVVPRRGCFLVDISSSVTRQTHLKNEGEFAYFLQSLNGSGANTNHDVEWAALATAGLSTRGTNPTVPTIHYRDDYVQIQPMNDLDFPSDPSDPIAKHHPNPSEEPQYSMGSGTHYNYMVDAFRDGTDYDGPQPLNTILAGLKSAIEIYKDRAVSGDKACIVFYDHQLQWARIVPPTNDFDYLLTLVDTSVSWTGSGAGATLSESSGLYNTARHALFPAIGAFTDTQAAVSEALSLLYKDSTSGVVTSDFLVLIGDGMTNCRHCPDGECTAKCSNSYTFYNKAMSELKNFVAEEVVPRNIPIHVIFVGESSGPHTVDIENPKTPGSCYSESELRALGIAGNSVMGGDESGNSYGSADAWGLAYANASSGSPFYQAGRDMYEIALTTKGIWAPIRPKGPACASGTEVICDPTATRRKTDPNCRDVTTQITDNMELVMGQNPYTVVSVD